MRGCGGFGPAEGLKACTWILSACQQNGHSPVGGGERSESGFVPVLSGSFLPVEREDLREMVGTDDLRPTCRATDARLSGTCRGNNGRFHRMVCSDLSMTFFFTPGGFVDSKGKGKNDVLSCTVVVSRDNYLDSLLSWLGVCCSLSMLTVRN